MEFDYLKCILIILVIVFHLTAIIDGWEYQTRIAYTFHIPLFLIISGFLTNVNKPIKHFCKATLTLFVPYAIFITLYVVSLYIVSSILPTYNKIHELSLSFILKNIFIDPTGTYWYLHTLLICNTLYFIVYKIASLFHLDKMTKFILFGLSLYVFGSVFGVIALFNVLYYAIGVAIRESKIAFLSFFQASFIAIVPFVILCCYSQNLNRGTIAGVIITYLAISFFLAIHKILPYRILSGMNYIGQNTLVIFLLSPIFIMFPRLVVKYFTFDPTGISFLIFSTCFMICGCLISSWIIDKLHISKYIFCVDKVLKNN